MSQHFTKCEEARFRHRADGYVTDVTQNIVYAISKRIFLKCHMDIIGNKPLADLIDMVRCYSI